jgi:hypothetical protein
MSGSEALGVGKDVGRVGRELGGQASELQALFTRATSYSASARIKASAKPA